MSTAFRFIKIREVTVDNDELLGKTTKILTVILTAYLLYITPENDIYGQPDFIDGIVAGALLYFVFYLPVQFVVYAVVGIAEIIMSLFKEMVRRPCLRERADIPPAHR